MTSQKIMLVGSVWLFYWDNRGSNFEPGNIINSAQANFFPRVSLKNVKIASR